jgi:hypothetical protein
MSDIKYRKYLVDLWLLLCLLEPERDLDLDEEAEAARRMDLLWSLVRWCLGDS